MTCAKNQTTTLVYQTHYVDFFSSLLQFDTPRLEGWELNCQATGLICCIYTTSKAALSLSTTPKRSKSRMLRKWEIVHPTKNWKEVTAKDADKLAICNLNELGSVWRSVNATVRVTYNDKRSYLRNYEIEVADITALLDRVRVVINEHHRR